MIECNFAAMIPKLLPSFSQKQSFDELIQFFLAKIGTTKPWHYHLFHALQISQQ
jgi:hypothetical protein